MASTKKRSNFWNYFEKLKPLLIKCTTCKKEIKISNRQHYITTMRIHLTRHGIFIDNDNHTLPDDLKRYYSELPKYKAKCKNCGKAMSFLTNIGHLREHLRRHSTIIEGRDEADVVQRKKRSKFWNYFEKLKPLLIKCTTCKKEIKISHPTYYTTTMRKHLAKHEIFLDNDIRTLPDDLKQYYSELPGYKAKCNDCGKALSFLTGIVYLREHLRRHSIRIRSRDEPSTSSLADNSADPSADRQSQDTSNLVIEFIEAIEETGELDKPSTSSSTTYIMDPSTGKYIPLHQSQEQVSSDLHVQSFEETAENTGVLDETTPTKKRSKLWNYFEELKPTLVKCTTCKEEVKISNLSNRTSIFRAHLKRHEIFIDNDSHTLPDDLKQYYSELPGYKAKCNDCGKTMSFLTDVRNLRSHLKKHLIRIQSRNEPSTSSSADYVMDPSAEHQSGESGFPVQSFEQMTEGTSALHSNWFYYAMPSASSSTCYVMAPSAEHQIEEQPGLPVQSYEQTTEGTSALYSCIGFYFTM